MRISQLKLKNCLGIRELEFKPGQITIIEGEEKQGKTSILESIQRFFWNKSERSGKFVYTDDEGTAEKAETYIDLDDGTTMKKYINSENKVTTTSIEKDGMSPKAPETFLKSLVNENQLNPIDLIHMDDKKLSELILSLIPIKVTPENLIEWVGEVPPFVDCNKHGLQVCKDVADLYYNKRTEVNRRIKDLEGEIKGAKAKLPENYDPEEWRNVSLTEKYDAIKEANQKNSLRQSHQAKINNKDTMIESLKNQEKAAIAEILQKSADGKKATEERIAELKRQIAALESELAQADAVCAEKVSATADHYKKLIADTENAAEESQKYLDENSVIDIEPLEAAHKETEEMKSYIRTADDLKAKEKELADKEAESKELTCKIEEMRIRPQVLLKQAKCPIPGMSVDGSNILVNGRPIINLSGGERIKFVMNIVRATAGPLKIILINGFEALSPKGQEEFIKECTGDGFQYIITRVTDGGLKITAIDENGTVRDAETGEQITIEG
jgi:hypothetical protein